MKMNFVMNSLQWPFKADLGWPWGPKQSNMKRFKAELMKSGTSLYPVKKVEFMNSDNFRTSTILKVAPNQKNKNVTEKTGGEKIGECAT